MKKRIAIMALGAVMAMAGAAGAAEFEVKMLNKGEKGAMVFEPDFVRAAPGDTVRFVPTDKGHNAQSVKGALPDGQEAFKGRINQEIEVEITAPGLIAVICQPHVTVGMAALIMAGGDVSNADDVLDARIRGKSADKIEELVAEAREKAAAES